MVSTYCNECLPGAIERLHASKLATLGIRPMTSNTRNLLFRILIGCSLGAAALTLIPWSAALVTNDLGYKSLCPFAPWSSLSLAGFAALLAVTKSYLASQKE